MIPVKLSVANFLCYRESVPPIELAAIRMACLTGENGAGKSALLDAMTWALWGRGRTNADTELMSVGATEMRVEFQFRVGERDYRVTRRVKRGSTSRVGRTTSPTTWLDLYVLDDDGEWRSLSGDGVKDTQARIIDVLRMEYETFINSAFLVQGRADEFTTKPAGERKKVLADILGLSAYDDMERLARVRHNERADSLRELDGERQRLAATLASEAEYHAADHGVRAELAALDAALVTLGEAHRGLTDRVRDLDQHEQRRAPLLRQVADDTVLLQRVQGWGAAAARELARLEALIAQREVIVNGAAKLHTVQQDRALMDVALTTLQALQTQRAGVERTIDVQRRDLQRDQRDLTRQFGELTDQARALPALEQERASLADAAGEATRLAQEITDTQARERQSHGEAEKLRGENALLHEQMVEMKRRQTQMDGAEVACPICRRPLSPGEQSRIHDEYQHDGLALRHKYDANKQRIHVLASGSNEVAQRLTALGELRRQAEVKGRQEARIGEQVAIAGRARDAAAAIQVRLVELTERLSRGEFAVEEQAALAAIDRAIADLAYLPERHEQLRGEERRLAPFAEQVASLRAAEAKLDEVREQHGENLRMADEVTQRIAEHQQQIDAVSVLVEGLPALRRQEADVRSELEVGQRQRADLQRETGRLQALLAACAEARARLHRVDGEYRLWVEERERYRELMEAFSKKGIQAMIIETIVPELEDEANALLDRMPGNSMRVELRTQRSSQAGDAIETLDVVIRDEVGARRYELFSGGEAFRVNFALRVALSKLLTRRAGAQLQTLIIDEGFGTQDSRGREGLIEAIHSIEPDFATILVISHMSDIRDEFGTRIEVSKGVDGSSVLVR